MAKTQNNKYFEGRGSRKRSTARVRIYEGDNASIVNGKLVKEFFTDAMSREKAIKPLVVTGMKDKMYFTATANGGGTTGQLDAVVLGLARAIVKYDESTKSVLRKEGFLTRDPREVERKKYYLVKARKKPQFSKR